MDKDKRCQLAIFWYANNHYFGYNGCVSDEDVTDKRDYGLNLIELNYTLRTIWAKLRERHSSGKYAEVFDRGSTYFARGKVVYDLDKQRYTVLCSRAIVNNDRAKEMIRIACNLPESVEFVSIPGHFHCSEDGKE